LMLQLQDARSERDHIQGTLERLRIRETSLQNTILTNAAAEQARIAQLAEATRRDLEQTYSDFDDSVSDISTTSTIRRPSTPPSIRLSKTYQTPAFLDEGSTSARLGFDDDDGEEARPSADEDLVPQPSELLLNELQQTTSQEEVQHLLHQMLDEISQSSRNQAAAFVVNRLVESVAKDVQASQSNAEEVRNVVQSLLDAVGEIEQEQVQQPISVATRHAAPMSMLSTDPNSQSSGIEIRPSSRWRRAKFLESSDDSSASRPVTAAQAIAAKKAAVPPAPAPKRRIALTTSPRLTTIGPRKPTPTSTTAAAAPPTTINVQPTGEVNVTIPPKPPAAAAVPPPAPRPARSSAVPPPDIPQLPEDDRLTRGIQNRSSEALAELIGKLPIEQRADIAQLLGISKKFLPPAQFQQEYQSTPMPPETKELVDEYLENLAQVAPFVEESLSEPDTADSFVAKNTVED